MSFDGPHAAGSLYALAASLDATETECGRVVESLSRQFQSLAGRVSDTLRVAGLAAASVEAGAVASIPAKVRTLVNGAERFVRERLDAVSAVLDVMENEQELVEMLLRINAANRSIAQEIRMLSVLTSIEVARLGDAGSGFQYLVKELRAASETVAAAAVEFAERAKSRNCAIQATQSKMMRALPRLRKQFQEITSQLQRALAEVNVSVEELSACPAEFKTCVEAVAGRISGVVSAIQSHDITRQQNEHVRDALADIATRLTGPEGGLNAREIALGLRVQALQVENIKQAIGAWSSQIDECLESLLNVSESRLGQVAPAVLAQEEQLFSRLAEIEKIETECESDSAEVDEALTGLSGLLELVRERAQQARSTRDRLQLLSFNSIIESRNLGAKADVMLEISRNITRIASEWGSMAARSSSTQTEIQSLMDQAHAGMASLAREKDLELKSARLEVVTALGDLKAAAQSNAANAADVDSLTAGLAEQIEAARSMSASLKASAAHIGESMEELQALDREIQSSAAQEDCDLAALEAAYSPSYTTEIERMILRAALYGEAIPAGAAAAGAGNDVELF